MNEDKILFLVIITTILTIFLYNKINIIWKKYFKNHKEHFKIQFSDTILRKNNIYTKFYCKQCQIYYYFDIENLKRFRL